MTPFPPPIMDPVRPDRQTQIRPLSRLEVHAVHLKQTNLHFQEMQHVVPPDDLHVPTRPIVRRILRWLRFRLAVSTSPGGGSIVYRQDAPTPGIPV
jgi:hypothetical protein